MAFLKSAPLVGYRQPASAVMTALESTCTVKDALWLVMETTHCIA